MCGFYILELRQLVLCINLLLLGDLANDFKWLNWGFRAKGSGSLVEQLPSICDALGLIPSTKKREGG